MPQISDRFSLRWVAVCVFVTASTLNYLDRALLATLAPLLMHELHFTQTRFGLLISAFSLAYALSSLLVGWFLDRAGVNRGMGVAVGFWSAAAVSTGLVGSFPGLAWCRAALGVGESAAVPAVGKLNGIYLKPEERALGAAVNQIGLSVGLALAPLSIGIAEVRGWRVPFIATGVLGFVWLPIWLAVSRWIPARYASSELAPDRARFSLLRDRNLLILVIANVLWMTSYSLWSNWTTLYLVHVHGLTLAQTKGYVWIPPVVSNMGGFFGAWLSLCAMRRGRDAVNARRTAIYWSVAGAFLALWLPLAPNAGWATAAISVSFFFALAGSVNLYALPIDIFGPARAGLAIAALTCAFGVMQMVLSPVIGWLGDHRLYNEVVWIATVPLLLSALVLRKLRACETPDASRNSEAGPLRAPDRPLGAG